MPASAKYNAKHITWRQAMMLEWIARGALHDQRGSWYSPATKRSLFRRGLIGYPYRSDGRIELKPLGFAVIVMLRKERKV